MEFPLPMDFAATFGLSPLIVEEQDAFFKYLINSKDGDTQVQLSFNGVSESFQVNLYCQGQERIVLSSEQVSEISIFDENKVAGVRIQFNYQGIHSEATIFFEPDLKVKWAALRM